MLNDRPGAWWWPWSPRSGLLTGPASADALADNGALFTQTNDPAGNAVQKFDRADDGSLSRRACSSPAALASQAKAAARVPVELSDDEDTVYAINAGSDSVTVFRVRDDDGQKPGLEIIGTVASGGVAPVSVDDDAASTCSTPGLRT